MEVLTISKFKLYYKAIKLKAIFPSKNTYGHLIFVKQYRNINSTKNITKQNKNTGKKTPSLIMVLVNLEGCMWSNVNKYSYYLTQNSTLNQSKT